MTCDCTTSHQERSMGIAACGSDCLNRMLLIECGKRCPCGEFCTNRNFKNKNNAKIVPFKTELKGWGIKSLQDLKPYVNLTILFHSHIFINKILRHFSLQKCLIDLKL